MRAFVLGLAGWVLCITGASASTFQPGDIFITGSDGNVYRYNESGTLLQTLSAGSTAYGLSFDSSGNLYVATGTAVVKFDSSGNSLGTFASGFPGMLGSATDVGFSSTGLAYVAGIQDTNYDFLSKYSGGGGLLSSTSVIQGQEGWVYIDASGNQILMTPGTTAIVDTFDPTTLAAGTVYPIVNGDPNGDVQSLAAGGFLVISSAGIEQFNAAGTFVFGYNPSLSGTFIGVNSQTASQFWGVSDFGEVREFNIGSGTPIASFDTDVDARGIAVFEGVAPEPSSLALLTSGLGLLVFVARRRRS